jgi:hypothetical protein
MKRAIIPIVVFIMILVTIPRFFDIYRTMAFNTVPRDDYAPYLQYIVGDNPGFTLYSPYAYRLFSFLCAFPFYKFAPVYQFTNLIGIDENYLRATQALALWSYLSILATCYIIFLLARNRQHLSLLFSLFTAFFAYLLFEFTNMYGVDPIAIFFISLLVYVLDQSVLFSFLVVFSVGVNEKIPFLFLLLLLSRLLTERRRFRYHLQLLSSSLSMAAYLLIRLLFHLPGYEYQTSLGDFFESTIMTLKGILSIKGTILNTIPVLMLLLIYSLAVRSTGKQGTAVFSRSDILPLIGLVLLGLFVRLEYNLGRIAMYSFPLYLPSAFVTIASYFSQFDNNQDHLPGNSEQRFVPPRPGRIPPNKELV